MSEVRLECGRWIDEWENSWDADLWTYELACKLSETLTYCCDCHNCIQCTDCDCCDDCQACIGCELCDSCYNCQNCSRCVYADYCFKCEWCNYIINCRYCSGCENIISFSNKYDLCNLVYYGVKNKKNIAMNIDEGYVRSFIRGDYIKYYHTHDEEYEGPMIHEPNRVVMISEINGYYVDQFDNRWDVNKFTLEQVKKLSLGLVMCYACDNCIGGYMSIDCADCVNVTCSVRVVGKVRGKNSISEEDY